MPFTIVTAVDIVVGTVDGFVMRNDEAVGETGLDGTRFFGEDFFLLDDFIDCLRIVFVDGGGVDKFASVADFAVERLTGAIGDTIDDTRLVDQRFSEERGDVG